MVLVSGRAKCSCSSRRSSSVTLSRNSRPILPNEARSGLPRSNCRSSCAVAGALRRARTSSRSERISLHHSGVGRMTKRCTSIVSREFLEKTARKTAAASRSQKTRRAPATAPRLAQRRRVNSSARARRMQTGRGADQLPPENRLPVFLRSGVPNRGSCAAGRRDIDRKSCAIFPAS